MPVTVNAAPAAAVRRWPCATCAAPARAACTPGGDHLARWLAACRAGAVTRPDLAAALRGLVVRTPAQVVTPGGKS